MPNRPYPPPIKLAPEAYLVGLDGREPDVGHKDVLDGRDHGRGDVGFDLGEIAHLLTRPGRR